MPDLTEQLRSERTDLLRQIGVPDLDAVRSRARTIRRRRQVVRIGASALALVAVVGVVGVLVRDSVGQRRAPVATAQPTPTTVQSVWRGGGLTLNGLDRPHLDLPGTLIDVQFADNQRAYAVAADCPEGGAVCGIAMAASTDGGHSWQEWAAPIDEAPAADLPRLVTIGTDAVALLGPNSYYRPSDSPQWIDMPNPSTAVDRVSADGRFITVGATTGQPCASSSNLRVLLPGGTNGEPVNPPAMSVCRTAPAQAPDGSLWISGHTDAAPAVGVSRDDGASWAVIPFPPGSSDSSRAQVATVGSEVYVTVVTPRADTPTRLTIDAVYRATAADPTFQLYAGRIGTVEGEVVPTTEGWLVAAGPNWYISDEPGATMHGAGGIMPWVGRIQRSPGGWVAYNLFDAGWVATSLDGRTWQKINLR